MDIIGITNTTNPKRNVVTNTHIENAFARWLRLYEVHLGRDGVVIARIDPILPCPAASFLKGIHHSIPSMSYCFIYLPDLSPWEQHVHRI